MGTDAPRRYLHPGLAAGRWKMLTFNEQMGNIGSEVERALRALDSEDRARLASAVKRALELFEFTLADERWHGSRHTEAVEFLNRFREAVADFPLEGEARRAVLRHELRQSFLEFAIAARTTPP